MHLLPVAKLAYLQRATKQRLRCICKWCQLQASIYLEQLKGSALLQLLEHGPQMPPAAPGLLQICLILSPTEQGPRGICKVCLERKQVLQSKCQQRLQTKKMKRAATVHSFKASWVTEKSVSFTGSYILSHLAQRYMLEDVRLIDCCSAHRQQHCHCAPSSHSLKPHCVQLQSQAQQQAATVIHATAVPTCMGNLAAPFRSHGAL